MNRSDVSAETRELAERLVALEAAAVSPCAADALSTCRVCEKLRRPLIALTGAAGFSSLFSRALTLAKREAPMLEVVQVRADGSLDGLVGDITQANTVLIAYLLSLLITFIGEALLMRLLHNVWPDLSEAGVGSPREEIK